MRTLTKLGAATLCVAAIAGDALAAGSDPTTLKGPIDRGGRAMIEISSGRVDGTPVRKYRWEFRRLTVKCDGRLRAARLPVTGGFAINAEFDGPGPWGISGTAEGDPHDPDYATRVGGRLVNEDKAKGWVRVYGAGVGLRSGRHAECDSGRLHWVVRD